MTTNGRCVKLCDFGLAVDHIIISHSKTHKSMTHTLKSGNTRIYGT